MTDHLAYPRAIVAGEIPAGEPIRLAAQRTLDDHARFAGSGRWEFVPAFAERVTAFVEHCPHVKGSWASRREMILLEPWQRWIVSELWGWRERADHDVRRFEEALVEVAKKNAKTTLCAALGLFELRFGDAGAEVISVATKIDQAKISWTAASQMVPKMDREIVAGIRVNVKGIFWGDCSFVPLASESKTLDGPNPSFVIVDESAAILDRGVADAITSATGARKGALVMHITTAQVWQSTGYYEKRTAALSMLRGIIDLDRTFAAIYQDDHKDGDEKSDDPLKDESVWIKTNPNLGVSVFPGVLRSRVQHALASPGERANVMNKNFNRWQGSAAAWVELGAWDGAAGPVGRSGPCWIGADLSQTRDLTAVCRLWSVSRREWAADFRCWIPQTTFDALDKRRRPIYEQAVETGALVVTEGTTTDLAAVGRYIRAAAESFAVKQIGLDPYNATELYRELEDEGLPVMLVRQTKHALGAATKAIESLILDGLIAHDGDPFTRWQLESAHVKPPDDEGRTKVVKGADPERKIDSVTALIVARAVADESAAVEAEPSFTFVAFE